MEEAVHREDPCTLHKWKGRGKGKMFLIVVCVFFQYVVNLSSWSVAVCFVFFLEIFYKKWL